MSVGLLLVMVGLGYGESDGGSVIADDGCSGRLPETGERDYVAVVLRQAVTRHQCRNYCIRRHVTAGLHAVLTWQGTGKTNRIDEDYDSSFD